MQAEVAKIGRDKVLQQRLAALVAKKNFIADQNIRGAELAAGDIGGKLFRLGKASPGAGAH
jgi:hypothetical protein